MACQEIRFQGAQDASGRNAIFSIIIATGKILVLARRKDTLSSTKLMPLSEFWSLLVFVPPFPERFAAAGIIEGNQENTVELRLQSLRIDEE